MRKNSSHSSQTEQSSDGWDHLMMTLKWKDMIRYGSWSHIFQFETKSVNLTNVLFKSWDWDF